MDSAGTDAQAFETTERVLAALRQLPNRDEALDALIARIEDDRAHLLAAMVGGQAVRRSAVRLRRPIVSVEEDWPVAASRDRDLFG